MVSGNALRDPMGRVGRSLGTGGLDTGSRGLGTGRGSTGARYRASVLGNGTKILLTRIYTANKLKWGKVKAEHYKTTRVSHFISCSVVKKIPDILYKPKLRSLAPILKRLY